MMKIAEKLFNINRCLSAGEISRLSNRLHICSKALVGALAFQQKTEYPTSVQERERERHRKGERERDGERERERRLACLLCFIVG